MNDDDRVLALLKDAAPPPPGLPRLDAIRAAAGRQRYARWTATLGTVLSVVLVAGLVAAAAQLAAGPRVRRVVAPVTAMADALRRQESVAFEATTRLVSREGPDRDTAYDGSATGRFARDGDGEMTVRLPEALAFRENGGAEPQRLRVVDGRRYRSVPPGRYGPGVTWLRDDDAGGNVAAPLLDALPRLPSLLTSPRYVGDGSVRGVRTAVYDAFADDLLPGTRLEVRFELDRHDLPRRLSATVPLGAVIGLGEDTFVQRSNNDGPQLRVQVDLYDYGVPVRVAAPPASEVAVEGDRNAAEAALRACAGAAPSQDELDACLEAYETQVGGGADCEGYFRTNYAPTTWSCVLPDGTQVVSDPSALLGGPLAPPDDAGGWAPFPPQDGTSGWTSYPPAP